MVAEVISSQNVRLARNPDRASPAAPNRAARWLRIFQVAFARTETAQAHARALASLPSDILRDTGLTPEEATGISAFQPDLPFFLQRGFGQR